MRMHNNQRKFIVTYGVRIIIVIT